MVVSVVLVVSVVDVVRVEEILVELGMRLI